MNASSEATEFRLATEIVFGLLFRCSTPIASQASRKICRMSLEVFVKRYLGYPVPIAPGPVDHPASVRMDQTPEQLAGIGVDDRALPVGKNDRALVLPAGTMLRKQTRPVAPVSRDGHASNTTDEAHPREIATQDLAMEERAKLMSSGYRWSWEMRSR